MNTSRIRVYGFNKKNLPFAVRTDRLRVCMHGWLPADVGRPATKTTNLHPLLTAS